MKAVHLILVLTTTIKAQLLFSPNSEDFLLADKTTAPRIFVADDEEVGVERTARDLAWDFGRVVGTNGSVSSVEWLDSITDDGPTIIAGTIGSSALIDSLVSDGKLDVSEVEGKWEAYVTQVVSNPAARIKWALVIAGNDRRGTIFGMYSLSEEMGVSPWYWWADVPVKTKTAIFADPEGKVQKSPSVKYRGFFINDEAPALSGWINDNHDGVFNGDFYRAVFELCLRLKGNYIWPAMWGKMFYLDDSDNGQIAHDYGIFMGTSHHEPMARSEKEQQNYLEGEWNWRENRENIETFFKEGIERASQWDTLWTMGMRGEGDAASPTLTAADLEELIAAQQSLLKETLNTTELMDIPQTWVLYKEVSGYHAAGMEVPDSVTLLWTDDNSGNLVRVPLANETDRPAGSGVYYHFDYVGGPRSYKWINTIQLVKAWEQMHLAFNKMARQIWIVNVGDIKPLEVPLTHFMDMAYDMDAHSTPDSTTAWIERWATHAFNSRIASQTASILNDYGLLVGRRKYELLSELPFAFSTIHYDEAQNNLAQWEDLVARTQAVYDSLDQATRTSFFQLILHPVLAGKTVVDLYTKTALNKLYFEQGRASTNLMAEEAHKLFADDISLAKRYHSMNGGKWNHFVNQVHIGYTSWDDPPNNENIMPSLQYIEDSEAGDPLGVGIQGTNATYPAAKGLELLPMDPFMPSTTRRYIDVFCRKNGTLSYTITSNVSYVTASEDSGQLVAPGNFSDARSFLEVDWEAAPQGLSYAQLRVTSDNDAEAFVTLPLNKVSVPSDFSGFVESNGVLSMIGGSFSSAESKNGVSYIEIPSYGRTKSGVKPWPVIIDTQYPDTGPALIYSFYATTSPAQAHLIVNLGASHNHDPTRPIKYAYSIDDSEPVTVRPVDPDPPYKEGRAWRKAVVENSWTSSVAIDGGIEKGGHELKLWLLEPGVVLQKIAIDMGGYQTTALGPPESFVV